MPEVLPIPRCGEHRQCLACAFPFWDKLTADQQELLCRATRPVRYRRGERVHSPVENCVGILLLRTGQFRAYLLSDDGRDVTLYRLFGGELRSLHRRRGGHRGLLHQRGRLPQPDAAERGGAVLRLPDDR